MTAGFYDFAPDFCDGSLARDLHGGIPVLSLLSVMLKHYCYILRLKAVFSASCQRDYVSSQVQ